MSAALFTSGCAGTPTRRSTGEFVDDASITTDVKAAFVRDPIVKALDVIVDTFKGTVQLNGFVDTSEMKARAEQIARGIPGVVGVQNALTVKSEIPAVSRAGGAALTPPPGLFIGHPDEQEKST